MIIKDYNPDWNNGFDELRNVLHLKLKDQDITIEHVGGTMKIPLKNTFLYIKSKYLIIKPFRMQILKILRIFLLFKEYFRMTR